MVKPPKKLGLVGLLTLGVASLCGGCMADRYLAKAAEKVIRKPQPAIVQVVPSVMPVAPVDARELYVWIYQDKNGNGRCDFESEILGEVNGPVNLDKYGLVAGLGNSSGEVKYSSWDSKGELMGEGSGRGNNFFGTRRGLTTGDFMDELNGSGEGKYKIMALDAGRTFCKEVEIYRGER